MSKIIDFLTANKTKIPLFMVEFDLNKHQKNMKSSLLKIHPNFKNDPIIEEKLKDLVDYIRDNYDMDNLL